MVAHFTNIEVKFSFHMSKRRSLKIEAISNDIEGLESDSIGLRELIKSI